MRRKQTGTREDRTVRAVLCAALVLCFLAIAPVFAQEAEEPEPTPTPTPTPSPTLSNDGIFGCRGQGANIANVGTLSAIGGVYVPVNDAAVTLNTGYLVYKECVLDAVARKIAENSTAEYAQQVVRASETSRGGNPQYVRNEYNEIKEQNNILVVNMLQNADNTNALCSAFRGSVRSTIARQYVLNTNQASSPYTCTLPGEGSSYWERLAALRDPRNNEYGAFRIMDELRQRTLAYNEFNQRQRWQRSGGFYDTVDNNQDPMNGNIITPGSIVQGSLSQMVGSGFRQLENANEIDQVVGNLWGGLTTQLIADTRGLSGLTQAVNGQPSYVERMVSQTSSSVRQQAANVALSVIGAARQIETSFRQAKEGIATALSNSIEQLRAAERQCWGLIIPKVQEAAGAGTQLNIATSTRFSQPIIDAQIAPLATSTIRDIRNSDAAIALLNELITSVSNSASQANQQQALLRLDTMVANRQLHTATDATNAATQRDNVASALTKLVEDTVKAWGDSTDPNVGWCNVNNEEVVTKWLNEWKI